MRPCPGCRAHSRHHCPPTPARERTLEMQLADLSPASRAPLLSQAGPHAARAFTVVLTSDDIAIPDSQFLVLLLRRLQMPLPRSPRSCTCRSTLDAYGDHRAAYSKSKPCPCAISRVCQEASPGASRVQCRAPMRGGIDCLRGWRQRTQEVVGTWNSTIARQHSCGQ